VQTLLTPLCGTRIHIEQHNDSGLTGWLVNVQADYASVLTADGRIVHYPLAHIKSVTKNITELPQQQMDIPEIAFPESFRGILTALWMQPVRIEIGEGSRQGVLVQITEETICLVLSSKEMIYYPICQIVNLSPVFQLKRAADDAPEPTGGGRGGGTGETEHAGETTISSNTEGAAENRDVTKSEAPSQSEAPSRSEASSHSEAPSQRDTAQLTLFRGDSSRSRRRRLTTRTGNARRTTGATSGTRAAFDWRVQTSTQGASANRTRPSWIHPRFRISPGSGSAGTAARVGG
jgi:hypothetical protein